MNTGLQLKTRFLIVGIWNTVFGYMVFFVLDTLFENIFIKRHFAYMLAMVLGHIIATINAFIFHKYVTFRSEVKGWGIIAEYFRFFFTYIITFTLSLILLPFFVEIVHLHPRIAAVIIILICTVISYIGHSRFSFKNV